MLTAELKKELIDLGYLNCQVHPTLPLSIYNYSQGAQFDKEAFVKYPILRQCRGLILDKENKLIAKAFDKFWNYEEYGEGAIIGELPPFNSFEITDKLDGSLIIVTAYNGELVVATRGSFESDQAKLATQILIRQHKNFVDYVKNYEKVYQEDAPTFLFELVGRSNRIVVDYPEDKLVALSVFNRGVECQSTIDALSTIDRFEIVRKYDGITDFKTIREQLPRDNAEGFVVRFDNGLRVKLKYAEYVRLHKILTGISSKTIWEMLMNGDSFNIVIEKVPDEFMDWVRKTKQKIEEDFYTIYLKASDIFLRVHPKNTRKEQAEYLLANHKDLAPIVFAMLDEKDYRPIIWKMVKPKYEQPFKQDDGA